VLRLKDIKIIKKPILDISKTNYYGAETVRESDYFSDPFFSINLDENYVTNGELLKSSNNLPSYFNKVVDKKENNHNG
jgi:hypothetical protein